MILVPMIHSCIFIRQLELDTSSSNLPAERKKRFAPFGFLGGISEFLLYLNFYTDNYQDLSMKHMESKYRNLTPDILHTIPVLHRKKKKVWVSKGPCFHEIIATASNCYYASLESHRQLHLTGSMFPLKRAGAVNHLILKTFGILLLFSVVNLHVINTHKFENIQTVPTLQSSSVDVNPSKARKLEELRERLPPSVWSQAGSNSDKEVAAMAKSILQPEELRKISTLCGKLLYSNLLRAVKVRGIREQTFVATGDTNQMWTRDSSVQMSLHVSRLNEEPFLKPVIKGTIWQQAFNTLEDPHANSYEQAWVDPHSIPFNDQVIGRGGVVGTRNYELDSGACFFMLLYDCFMAEGVHRPDVLISEPMIFDAVMLLVKTWMVEQNHEEQSPHRCFELPREGKGTKTGCTGMTWTGFRPSDDASECGYSIPSNIFAAGALGRVVELNEQVWRFSDFEEKATQLLREIEDGIRQCGVVEANDTKKLIYAYEVNGLGDILADTDDANAPSLSSIPMLGWTRFDREIYKNARDHVLSSKNPHFHSGKVLQGVGSSHTRTNFVWPMAMAVQALTKEGSTKDRADEFVFQLRQSVTSACNGVMHESVSVADGCRTLPAREWFEWANALFVVLAENALHVRCDAAVLRQVKETFVRRAQARQLNFYQGNRCKNNHNQTEFYQGLQAMMRPVEGTNGKRS